MVSLLLLHACGPLSLSLHTITSFPASMGVKTSPYLFGAGVCFPMQGDVAHALLAHHLRAKNTLRKLQAAICSPQGKLWSNQHCNSNHKTVVKWISLRTKWNLDCRNWNNPCLGLSRLHVPACLAQKQANESVNVEIITWYSCTNYSNFIGNIFY